jgi:hypothetical protein
MKLAPTRYRLLLGLSLVTFLASYVLILSWYNWKSTGWDLAWSTAIAMMIFVVGLFGWTLLLRARLRSHSARLHAITVARSAALALATSRVGAIVFGSYLGQALFFGTHQQVAINSERFAVASTTAVFGLLAGLVALWLEAICRLPEPSTQG